VTVPPSAACRMTTEAIVVPPAPDGAPQVVDALLRTGELVVIGTHLSGLGDSLSVWDPSSGSLDRVVTRTTPKSFETAVSQIWDTAGSADWVVWQESGFSLEVGDWVLWAANRHTGVVRKVASSEPGPNGLAAPGFPSNISVLGDLAAWSAPVPLPKGHIQERIYVADLATGKTKRLDPVARWPMVVSADSVVAAHAVGATAANKVLADVAKIAIKDGTATSLDFAKPAQLVALATSRSGTVAVRLIRQPSAEDSTNVAEILARLDDTNRVFPLPVDWGPVGAGDGFLAWTDQLHLWVLLSGTAEPLQLAEIDDQIGNLRILAAGPYLFWHTDAEADHPEVNELARIGCP
jgi:hypothetical protein